MAISIERWPPSYEAQSDEIETWGNHTSNKAKSLLPTADYGGATARRLFLIDRRCVRSDEARLINFPGQWQPTWEGKQGKGGGDGGVTRFKMMLCFLLLAGETLPPKRHFGAGETCRSLESHQFDETFFGHKTTTDSPAPTRVSSLMWLGRLAEQRIQQRKGRKEVTKTAEPLLQGRLKSR